MNYYNLNKYSFYSNSIALKCSARLMYMLLLCCFISCQQTVSGQEVPQAVQSNFDKMYPGEKDPNWHIDSHGYYEAHFKKDGIKYRADYNKDGSWYETETSIKVKELPKAIRKAIKEQFSQYEISEVEKVQHSTKGLFYDVEFKRKGKNKDVEFREDGSVLYITP